MPFANYIFFCFQVSLVLTYKSCLQKHRLWYSTRLCTHLNCPFSISCFTKIGNWKSIGTCCLHLIHIIVSLCLFFPPLDNIILTVHPDSVSIYKDGLQIPDGDKVQIIADEMTTISCTVKRARPAASIEWFLDGVNKTEFATQTVTDDGGLKDTISDLSLTLSSNYCNKNLKCKGYHPETHTQIETSVTLDVLGNHFCCTIFKIMLNVTLVVVGFSMSSIFYPFTSDYSPYSSS